MTADRVADIATALAILCALAAILRQMALPPALTYGESCGPCGSWIECPSMERAADWRKLHADCGPAGRH